MDPCIDLAEDEDNEVPVVTMIQGDSHSRKSSDIRTNCGKFKSDQLPHKHGVENMNKYKKQFIDI